MKVVIVSDTHRKNQSFFRVVEAEQPDMVIHCGDSEGSEYALTEGVSCPVHLVMGNCDSYSMGLPKDFSVIGVDAAGARLTFQATKDIRDKYVLSRLAWDLGVLDELCARLA